MMFQKQQIRSEIRRQRNALSGKEVRSRQIVDTLQTLECYRQADTILYYVDVRDEVRTRHVLADVIGKTQRIGVPYCEQDSLCCVELNSMEELCEGAYAILEPEQSVRENLSRRISPAEIDVVLVPGVAFDKQGARLGHGKGYYDRLLELVRPDCMKIGLAYRCQMVEEVPVEPHDILMDLVITEDTVMRTDSI